MNLVTCVRSQFEYVLFVGMMVVASLFHLIVRMQFGMHLLLCKKESDLVNVKMVQ